MKSPSDIRGARWFLLRQILKLYERFDLAYFPVLQLEQLDYQRSLDARPTRLQVENMLNQKVLNYCDIGARGELPRELTGFEDLLSLVLFEPEKVAADALVAKWRNQAEIHCVAVGPSGRYTFSKTSVPGASSLLDPNGEGRAHLGLSQGNYAYSKIKIVEQFEIECQPLEQMLEPDTRPIDILKIDAQGFDYEILTTLGSHRPFVIKVETSTVPIYVGQKTLGTVLNYLEGLGYMATRLPFGKPHIYARSRRNMSISVGDLVVVPDFTETGRSIVHRDIDKWRASLALFGLSDLCKHHEWAMKQQGVTRNRE